MNTDNKARLIEVLDKALNQVLHLHKEHADMIADRIEAAGLLAGSVGVDIPYFVSTLEKCLTGELDSKEIRDALLFNAHLLTRSPEPKGR